MKRFVGFWVVLLVTAAAAGWTCWRKGGPAIEPSGVAVETAVDVERGLNFEKTLLEIPVAADAMTTVADFCFTNSTDRPITIDRVEKDCSCATVQVSGGKLCYAPGEKGVIRATFELGNLAGEVEKSMTLFLAGDPDDKPTHTLTVRVRIPVLVKLSQKTLRWPLGGQAQPQKIDIEMVHTKPIRVLSTQCSTKGFMIELKAIEEGRRYELWVTPAATTEAGMGLIRLDTDCEIPRHRVQQVFAVIQTKAAGEGGAATP
jgi:hypothetical protein